MPKSLYIDPVKVREPGYIHFEDIPVCQYNKTVKQELEEGSRSSRHRPTITASRRPTPVPRT